MKRDHTSSKQKKVAAYKDLPVLELAGTDFLFDAESGLLRQADKPDHTIPFSSFQFFAIGHVRLWYDSLSRNSVDMTGVKTLAPGIRCLEFTTAANVYPLALAQHNVGLEGPPYILSIKQVAIDVTAGQALAKRERRSGGQQSDQQKAAAASNKKRRSNR